MTLSQPPFSSISRMNEASPMTRLLSPRDLVSAALSHLGYEFSKTWTMSYTGGHRETTQ